MAFFDFSREDFKIPVGVAPSSFAQPFIAALPVKEVSTGTVKSVAPTSFVLPPVTTLGEAPAQSGGAPDYAQYVLNHSDLSAAYRADGQSPHIFNEGYDLDKSKDINLAEYGKFHYDNFGRNEGRVMPVVASAASPGSQPVDVVETVAVSLAETAPPVTPVTPVLVSSAELPPELDNNAPVAPAVFHPTILEPVVQFVGPVETVAGAVGALDVQPVAAQTLTVQSLDSEVLAVDFAVLNSEASSSESVLASSPIVTPSQLGGVSNIDIGLLAAGGIGAALIGFIAIKRNK